MRNTKVNVIYDLYILSGIVVLFIYGLYMDKSIEIRKIKYKFIDSKTFFTNKVFLAIIILSPVIFIVLTGKVNYFLIYGTSQSRGLTESLYSAKVTSLLLLSIYGFCCIFFSQRVTLKRAIILTLYSMCVVWISGKRFLFAVMGVMFLYFYVHYDLDYKDRKKIARIVPIFMIVLLAFSAFYVVMIRPLSNTGWESVYEMLRKDYGRDDVIKYVIYKMFILKEPILDYYGQTFLSTFFIWVPRTIWLAKPYPHYMYLTASILNVPIFDLPAGTTPSWFEMCIANFSTWGFLIGIFLLCLFCYWADKCKKLTTQILILMLIVVLLTQSMDAYIMFIAILFIQFGIKLLLNNKRIVFKWK
jgi:hypothetical protein